MLRILRRAIAQVIPTTACPSRHRVRFAHDRRVRGQQRGINARSTCGRVRPLTRLRQRRLRYITFNRRIVGQRRKHQRQTRHRNGIVVSIRVKHDRKRLAPIALTREQPITQTVIHPHCADPSLLKPRNHDALRIESCEPVERNRRSIRTVYRTTLTTRRRVAGVRNASDLHHLHDGQRESTGKIEVALVVGWHRHNCASAVTHEYILSRPHRNARARRGIHHEQTGCAARLFLRLLTVDIGAIARPGDVLGELRITIARDRMSDQRMLGRQDHICRAKQRVGPRGEHRKRFRAVSAGIDDRKANLRALTATDPFRLQRTR